MLLFNVPIFSDFSNGDEYHNFYIFKAEEFFHLLYDALPFLIPHDI